MVGFSLLIGAGLISASLISFQNSAVSSVRNQMSTLAADRSAAIQTLMTGVQSDLATLAASPSASEALVEFSGAWAELGGEAPGFLTDAYISLNPHETGQKHLLDRAEGSEAYHGVHAHYHPGLRTLIETKGYYDAFLISPAGDIVYSVFKELDYATNLLSGRYKASGLGDLFKRALASDNGEIVFDDMRPYEPSFGAAAAFIATKVIGQDGAFLGVAALQIPVGMLGEIVNNADGIGSTTEIFIAGRDNLARTTSRFEGGYQVLGELPEAGHIAAALAGKSGFFEQAKGLKGQDVIAYSRPLDLGFANWALVAEQDLDEVMAPVRQKGSMLLLIGMAIVAGASVCGWLFARTITRPLDRICSSMKAVSSGELETEVTEAARGDEIGQIGQTLVSMQEDLKKARGAEDARALQQQQQAHVVETLSAGLLRLSQGDFSTPIAEAFDPGHEKLRADFNKTVETLSNAVAQVVEASASIRRRAGEISLSSDDLSGRTESQAATLEETAAALEQMTVSVKSAAEGTQSVRDTMEETRGAAESSGQVVQDAVTAMTEIEQSSAQIGQIIGVIDDIAFQTNLLALNAGVEAARAGEAGRGFAVVASEVRALAQRSSEAAMDIKTLISGSSAQVSKGVDLVGRAGEALQGIVERVSHISTLVNNIAESASEQSSGLSEINVGAVQLDKMTQQNAAMVEEAKTAARILDNDAGTLMELVSSFRVAGAPVSAGSRSQADAA
jgi:methyl-accepting chemotaxis protein